MANTKAKAQQSPRFRAEDYSYSVAWAEADQCFFGRVTEFPSLSAFAATQIAALQEINEVVGFVLEDMAKAGEAIPEPLSKRQYSGKLNLRVPETLHRKLSLEAARQGVSLDQFIASKLSATI